MQIGMVGLGRMGGNMVRRLLKAGHSCVGYDRDAAALAAVVREGATGASSPKDLVQKLKAPRAVCLMLPAARTDAAIDELAADLEAGDAVVDGGNSHWPDDIARAERLRERGLHYVDMGTSGGTWGLERGYCLMIGGDPETVRRLDPFFRALAPGPAAAPPTPGRAKGKGTAEHGYLHCGPAGAGHFVKMVHNGIEYGLMAAYAEGFNLLHRANVGKATGKADAETAPLRDPHLYQYDLDVSEVAEVWRRGSVVGSWLLDLAATAMVKDPTLEKFGGRVSDSGEGRWALQAAIDAGVPAHVLSAALLERFASRDLDLFQNKVLSAMRLGFGGHEERHA